MGNKAQNVTAIDRANKKATIMYGNGATYERQFVSLDRNTMLKVVKMLGYRFNTGRAPLSYTQWELVKIADKLCNGETIPTPERPVISVTEPVKATEAIAGRVEKAVADVIADALKGIAPTQPTIDPEAIRSMVADTVNAEIVKLNDKVALMERLVRENKPTVTNVTIGNGETKPITGRTHEKFTDVLRVVSAGLFPWLTGGAGVGKTTIAQQVAEVLDLPFDAEGFCAQSSKSELKGYKDGNGLYNSTKFRERFEQGGVYLLDEIDGANPNILLALNSALSNGFMAFPDGTVKRHKDFIAIACANTYGNGATAEYVGRQVIDGASIDRFVKMDIPIDTSMEAGVVNDISMDALAGREWLNVIARVRANVANYGLKVIVSPRSSINGAKLLNAGFTYQQCVPMTFGSGVKPETLSKMMEGVNVPAGGAIITK
jgi:cobaltochelatase CobS